MNIIARALTPAFLQIITSMGSECVNKIKSPNTLAWAAVNGISAGRPEKTIKPA